MKKNGILVAAIIIGSQAVAQQDTGYKKLDGVIVTANKFEQKQSSTGKVITVISKEQIERNVGKTVSQLLNEEAGITIGGALNTLGSTQSLFTRGTATGRTLVLLDGIPMNDPSEINNNFDLNLFTLDNIERIEICRGPQSTLYGSDAIGGVINIITVDKNIEKAFNVKATLAGGNYGTAKGNVQAYGKVNKLTYAARYAKLRTDGFSAAHDKTGTGQFDNDGYNGDVASANLQYQFTPQFSVKTFGVYSRYKTDIDQSSFSDDKDFTITNKSFTTGAGFQFKNDNVLLVGNYQYSDLNRLHFNDSTDKPGSLSRDTYYGKTQFAELYANIKLFKGISLLQGADFRHHSINQKNFSAYPAFPPYPAGSFSSQFDSVASQASMYASLFYSGLQSKLNIELGGRLNVHSRFGSNYTYTFNPSYKINDHFRVFGTIATGYKAPSLYQLYSAYGNNMLKPETSTNYEIGLQEQFNNVSSRLVFFHRNVKNGIDFDNIKLKYINFVKQKANGLEYEITVRPLQKLDVTANYTFMDLEETSQGRKNFDTVTYNYAIKRPKHNFNINIGYTFTPAFYLNVSGKYVSKRYDFGGYMTDDVVLSDYFIMGAYGEYKLKGHYTLFVNAQNVTGRKFFDVNGYNSIPFMIVGGVSLKF